MRHTGQPSDLCTQDADPTLWACGICAKRKTMQSASSRSRTASIIVGYRSLIKWSISSVGRAYACTQQTGSSVPNRM